MSVSVSLVVIVATTLDVTVGVVVVVASGVLSTHSQIVEAAARPRDVMLFRMFETDAGVVTAAATAATAAFAACVGEATTTNVVGTAFAAAFTFCAFVDAAGAVALAVGTLFFTLTGRTVTVTVTVDVVVDVEVCVVVVVATVVLKVDVDTVVVRV